MISKDKYNDLERYANQEMTENEHKAFEEEFANNKELRDYLKVYQEAPTLLQHMKKDKVFEQQLQAAKMEYETPKKSKSPNYIWIIGGIILITVGLLIWKMSSKTVDQEEVPPELIFAEAFNETEQPILEFQRNAQTETTDRQLYKRAFGDFENSNFEASINTLDSISVGVEEYASALELKGYMQYLQQDYSGAITTFNKFLALEDVERDVVIWYQTFAYFENNQLIDTKSNLNLIIDQSYPQAEKAKKLLLVIEE